MSNVLLQLCLEPDSIDGAAFAALVRHRELGFEPATISSSFLGTDDAVPFDDLTLDRLATAKRLVAAEVMEDMDRTLSVSGIAGHAVDQVIWEGPALPSDAFVEQVVLHPAFRAGHAGDDKDMFWQSESSLRAYRAHGRSHDHLPKVPGGFFPGEHEEIDVSRNPGRRSAVDGIWLCAAATMWFGEYAFTLLNRDRLMATPVGEVVNVGDTVLRVDLFPFEWYRHDVGGVRERQSRFREWMGYDAISDDQQPEESSRAGRLGADHL
jgi:hypothetical protein